jgi:rhamnosyltransferase
MSRVVAVVPTHKPDPTQLHALLDRLTSWDIPVVVSDDASPQPTALDALSPDVHLVRHAQHAGIARGLNDGLRFAQDASAEWLLTVDQDTSLEPGYLTALLDQLGRAHRSLSLPVGAVAAGWVQDASGPLHYPTTNLTGIPVTAEVIQTGTLWSVSGLGGIGGFDEDFGIDAVDAAACVRLRASGFAIVLAPQARLDHRIGQARKVTILGHPVMATGHSPSRRETMVRNRLLLASEEYHQSPLQALRSLRRLASGTLLALTIEEERWAKAKATARGIRQAWATHSRRRDSVEDRRTGGGT